ncbi:hypothetical protein [Coralliovum pocilloporae]|uniref:hypothetical protein n=1 Tax=Coralliovum pocilloporae TaxID=3066369 RepID=UPI00330752E9
MTGKLRHGVGLGIAALLIGLIYYGWDTGLPMFERELRGLRLFGKNYPELATLLAVFGAYGLMSFAQWLWDKVPGGDHHS